MQLAAVDIGSNAIRLQIVRVIREQEVTSFKKTEFLRFPLRLGEDVFNHGEILPETRSRFIKLMTAFKLLIDLYQVDGYMAVATSAMREAANADDVIQAVMEASGLQISIIDGHREAEILSKAIVPVINAKSTYVHIDVGGGSTELNVYQNKERLASKSFNLGSVRSLNEEKRKAVFQAMQEWYGALSLQPIHSIFGIGTGGNINKLYNLSSVKGNDMISLLELNALHAYISTFNLEQRITHLKLNPDRADVILPACEIYTNVLQMIGASYVLVPGVGLKDGLVFDLFEQLTKERIQEANFLNPQYMED